MKNFQCEDCGQEFYEPTYHLKVQNGENVYYNRHGLLKCPQCKSEKIEYTNDNVDYSNVQFGKFASMSQQDKGKIIKKRAADHAEKTKEERMYRKAQILKKAI